MIFNKDYFYRISYLKFQVVEILYFFVFRLLIEHRGFSDFVFTVNIPPRGGFCNINPREGVTIQTTFFIRCGNWEDEDTPLAYRVGKMLNFICYIVKPKKITQIKWFCIFSKKHKNLQKVLADIMKISESFRPFKYNYFTFRKFVKYLL